MELPLQQQQQQQASPAPRLNILSATWGPRTGKKVAVTHLLQRWVQIHGAGAYLHLPTLEAKKEYEPFFMFHAKADVCRLLGAVSGRRLDLCIKYCLDNGEVYEETFGELRGVLLDDVSLYYICAYLFCFHQGMCGTALIFFFFIMLLLPPTHNAFTLQP